MISNEIPWNNRNQDPLPYKHREGKENELDTRKEWRKAHRT